MQPTNPSAREEAVTFHLLARARDQLRARQPLDPAVEPLVLAAVELALSKKSKEAEKRLRQAALRRRNDEIREAAGKVPGDSIHARGVALLTAANRYRASSWRHHRSELSCPASIRGTAQEHLWIAFQVFPTFPNGIRQIQAIIAPT